MDEQAGGAGDVPDPVVLDEAFIRAGRYEPPARTRAALAQYADRDTSWRHPRPSILRPKPSAPERRQAARRAGRADHAVSPFFALLAAFAASLVALWVTGSRYGVFAVVLTGWLVSLCLHEFAHARVAYAGGDRSVAVRGYLSLDLRRYAHPVLSYVLPVLWIVAGGVGLPGGAVWIDRSALRSRWRRTAVSLAGPATNAVCAGVCLTAAGWGSRAPGPVGGHVPFWAALAFLGFLQLSAAAINLLPIPGLDGWGAIEPYLPDSWASAGRTVAPFGAFVVLFLLFRSAAVSGTVGRGFEHVAASVGTSPVLIAVGSVLFRFWSRA